MINQYTEIPWLLRRMRGAGRGAAVAGVAAVTLAACSGSDVSRIPPCPNVVIVDDIAQVTKFLDGPGRDLTDVVLEARIAGFDGSCVTDLDSGDAGEVEVDLLLVVEATRGPANADRRGRYDFFVAIAKSEGDILAKRVFPGEVVFEGNRTRVATEEELTQLIPLQPGTDGSDYDILVGFQLTADELTYARQQQDLR